MKKLMMIALCALAAKVAMAASGVGFPVTVTVKDWTGKVVTTVRGVTFDGNFTLDVADYFNATVDYVTAFDGGTVSAAPSEDVVSGSAATRDVFRDYLAHGGKATVHKKGADILEEVAAALKDS